METTTYIFYWPLLSTRVSLGSGCDAVDNSDAPGPTVRIQPSSFLCTWQLHEKDLKRVLKGAGDGVVRGKEGLQHRKMSLQVLTICENITTLTLPLSRSQIWHYSCQLMLLGYPWWLLLSSGRWEMGAKLDGSYSERSEEKDCQPPQPVPHEKASHRRSKVQGKLRYFAKHCRALLSDTRNAKGC